MGSSPAVSVVLTTYNQARYVDEALASISAQTVRDFEVVIVDDASTDDTVDHIRRWLPTAPVPVRLIVNERNLGAPATRNLGVAQSRGEYIAGLAGDDAAAPERIEIALARFRAASPSVAVVHGDAWLMDVDGRRVGTWSEVSGPPPPGPETFAGLLERCFVCMPTAMVRRTAFDAVGGYDERHFVDDHSLLLRLADRFDFAYDERRLTSYRLNPEGMTRNPAYRARSEQSRVDVLLEWHGRDARHDATIEPIAWRAARRAVAIDPAIGRPLVRRVCAAAPTPTRRVQTTLAHVPGAPKLLAGLFRLHDRRRARRAGLDTHRGELDAPVASRSTG